jgi:hypothetical protein
MVGVRLGRKDSDLLRLWRIRKENMDSDDILNVIGWCILKHFDLENTDVLECEKTLIMIIDWEAFKITD